jgi:two-component system, LytTR family, response regulator
MIRALIVDDEPRARKGIKARLQAYPHVQVIGECDSGTSAVESIHSLQPDLVFLDIQMPELDGFEVLGRLTLPQLPVVIFVTAFDSYAIKAFEVHAFDYLLKPLNEDRFRVALTNAVTEIERRNLVAYSEKIKGMMNDYLGMVGRVRLEHQADGVPRTKEYLSRFMIKTTTHITVISVDEIFWIESAGDLIYLHTNLKKHIYRETLTSLETELDPSRFVRIHRSAMVNIEKVKHIHAISHGDYDVTLENDVKLRLSRTYREHFQNVLQRR